MAAKEGFRGKEIARLGLFMLVLSVGVGVYGFLRPAGAKVRPEDIAAGVRPPRMDGTHPCVFATRSGGSLTTGLGRCSTPLERSGEVDRFEADLRYGSFVLRRTDLRISDVFDVPLTRSYSTNDWIPTNKVHAFGVFSNHPYDVAPLGTRRPYTYLMLVLEDGDYLYYKRISQGQGFGDAVYMHVETSTRFYKSILWWNGDGWTLRLADGEQMRFPEAYASKNLAQGAVEEMRNGSGAALTLTRDSERNLHEIRTPHDHWIRFAYNGDTTIRRAEDDSGRWRTYEYSNGMLTLVSDSSGPVRRYEYEGRLMTAVLDEHGRTMVRNEFKSGRLVGQMFGNGDSYRYEYSWRPEASYPDQVRVTLPNHSQQTFPVGDSVPDSTRQP